MAQKACATGELPGIVGASTRNLDVGSLSVEYITTKLRQRNPTRKCLVSEKQCQGIPGGDQSASRVDYLRDVFHPFSHNSSSSDIYIYILVLDAICFLYLSSEETSWIIYHTGV